MRRFILDGYNLIFRDEDASPGASLADRRDDFLRRVDAMRGPGQDVVVVFDGRPAGGSSSPRTPGLRVTFSRSPRTADDLIVSMVGKSPRNQSVVITRDRELMARVKSAGGVVASPDEFFRVPSRRRSSPPTKRGGKPAPPRGSELDEWERLFEEGAADDEGSAD